MKTLLIALVVILGIAGFLVLVFSLMNVSHREDVYSEQYYMRKLKENESRK